VEISYSSTCNQHLFFKSDFPELITFNFCKTNMYRNLGSRQIQSMINNFQTPDDFNTDLLINGRKVVYHKCHEISQGGPLVGELSIDGRFIPGQSFGGPLLYNNKLIYVPILVKMFLGSGFKLAIINTDTFKLEIIGNTKSLIFLVKIDGQIYFFEDISKTRYSHYQVEV